jgi:hypothetical protein
MFWWIGLNISEEITTSIFFYLEVGGRRLLRNVDTYLPIHTASHLRKPKP